MVKRRSLISLDHGRLPGQQRLCIDQVHLITLGDRELVALRRLAQKLGWWLPTNNAKGSKGSQGCLLNYS